MLKTLTSLRFFAILIVYLSHLFFMKLAPGYKEVFERFFSQGSIGVTFFLILSGFVMSYNYLDRFESVNFRDSKVFMIKRMCRIYPIHILTLIISMPVANECFNSISIVGKILLNVLLLQSVALGKSSDSFNPVSWTLSCLLVFYALTPVMLFSINKIIKKYSLSSLYYIMGGIYIIGFIAVTMLFDENNPMHPWFFYKSPFFRIIDYAMGLIIGVIFKYNKEAFSTKTMNILEPAIIILSIIIFALYPMVSIALQIGMYYIPITALVIFIFAYQKGFISKLLSKDILVKLGDISFSFYLIHYLVIKYSYIFIENFLKVKWSGSIIVSTIIFTFIVSITLALLMYKYIEIPLKNKIRIRNKTVKVNV